MPVPVNSFSFEHLNALKRKDLLQLCKDNGIKATGKVKTYPREVISTNIRVEFRVN